MAQELAGHARRDHHLDLSDLFVAQYRREFADRICRDRVGLLNDSSSPARRAIGKVNRLMTATHALACHLQNAKGRDRRDRGLGPVARQALLETILHFLYR